MDEWAVLGLFEGRAEWYYNGITGALRRMNSLLDGYETMVMNKNTEIIRELNGSRTSPRDGMIMEQ